MTAEMEGMNVRNCSIPKRRDVKIILGGRFRVQTKAAWLNITSFRARGRTNRKWPQVNFDFDGAIKGGHAFFPPYHTDHFVFELILSARQVRCHQLLPSWFAAKLKSSVKSDIISEFAGTMGSNSGDEHVLGHRWTADFQGDMAFQTKMFLEDPCKENTRPAQINVSRSSVSYNLSADAIGGRTSFAGGPFDFARILQGNKWELEKAETSFQPLKFLILKSMLQNSVFPVLFPLALGLLLGALAYALIAPTAKQLAPVTDIECELRPHAVELTEKLSTRALSTTCSTPLSFSPAPSLDSLPFWKDASEGLSTRAPSAAGSTAPTLDSLPPWPQSTFSPAPTLDSLPPWKDASFGSLSP
jgi:hypothetical protein